MRLVKQSKVPMKGLDSSFFSFFWMVSPTKASESTFGMGWKYFTSEKRINRRELAPKSKPIATVPTSMVKGRDRKQKTDQLWKKIGNAFKVRQLELEQVKY